MRTTTTAVLAALLAASVSANVILLLPNDAENLGQGDNRPAFDAKFNGRAVEVKEGPGGNETVTFNITRVIKQSQEKGLNLDHSRQIDVVSDGGSQHCFFDFEKGMIYTVISRLDGSGYLVTNACWGTQSYGGRGLIPFDHTVYPVPWESLDPLDSRPRP